MRNPNLYGFFNMEKWHITVVRSPAIAIKRGGKHCTENEYD